MLVDEADIDRRQFMLHRMLLSGQADTKYSCYSGPPRQASMMIFTFVVFDPLPAQSLARVGTTSTSPFHL